MFSSNKTSRSYEYSGSGAPSQGTVTETRTYIDSDGRKKTETTTRTTGGDSKSFGGKVGGWVSDVGNKMSDLGIGIPKITFKKSKPTEARYSRGGSSRRSDKPSTRNALPVSPEGKTYDEIKQQCLSQGKLFEDPDFPATDSSIFYSRSPPRPFVWKRPPELVENPELFVGGATRFDVKQGELGDCWLLAAVACLTTNEKLLHHVVPEDQGFSSDVYCGAIHFRFWRFGKWEDVIIDDRLPTYNNKLVFMHSDSSNEFWTALLEKAYAKVHGSYESLKGGATSEALEDFTGGMSENYDFRTETPNNLFKIMMQAQERGSMMGCSIEAMPGKMEAELENGLIMGHAYSVTAVKLMSIKTSRSQGKIQMVRVRNPWGNECEWKGAWSDQSQEWKFIAEEERQHVGLTFGHDGEFWMAFNDFTKNFQKLEIVHLGVEMMDDNTVKWSCSSMDGSWNRRMSAGGCRNFLDTFWTNPQYRVKVTDTDDNDEEELGTLIVALMQKNRRKLRKEGLDMLTMGYVIYKLKDPDCGPLDMNFFKYNASVAKSPSFINMREVCGRHRLPPGEYCILPSTFEPNQEGDFLIRIYSEKPSDSSEMDEETGISDVEPEAKVSEADRAQEETIRRAFTKMAGEDMEIDAYELKDILNAAYQRGTRMSGLIDISLVR